MLNAALGPAVFAELTHDMGVANCFSRPGSSSYEKFGLQGCFSHTTHEQLVNWVCCAVSYVRQTGDRAWLKKKLPTFRVCLRRLANRDHPDPRQCNCVMSADSSRCLGGAEITTFDSTETSLGQVRNNRYLVVKTWATYLGWREVFATAGLASPGKQTAAQAELAAAIFTLLPKAECYIPAILVEGGTSRIIPAIEGLVFPQQWGLTDARPPTGPNNRLHLH